MNKQDIELYGYAYFIKFLDYFIRKGFLYKKFRLKYFNRDESYRCFGGYRPFTDIDMSIGQVRYALAFGHSHGYVLDVSRNKRCLDLVRLRGDGFL